MQRDLEAALDGAIGGVGGTMTMSVVMLTAGKLGLMGEQPPELIVTAALKAADLPGRHNEETQNMLAVLMHFGFGIATGSLFGVLRRRLHLPISPLLHGAIYGTLIWLVSYKGWVPKLGIMPPPGKDQPPQRPVAMLIAHWVFGATLAAIIERYPSRKLRM